MLYLLTFTKAAVVCDSTVIPMTIPSKEHLFLRPYKMKNIVLSTIEQVRGILSAREQCSNAVFIIIYWGSYCLWLYGNSRDYSQCDFWKRHISQCGSYPFTDCWGLKHENRFKAFTAFWISIEQCTFEDPRFKCDFKMHLAYITST